MYDLTFSSKGQEICRLRFSDTSLVSTSGDMSWVNFDYIPKNGVSFNDNEVAWGRGFAEDYQGHPQLLALIEEEVPPSNITSINKNTLKPKQAFLSVLLAQTITFVISAIFYGLLAITVLSPVKEAIQGGESSLSTTTLALIFLVALFLSLGINIVSQKKALFFCIKSSLNTEIIFIAAFIIPLAAIAAFSLILSVTPWLALFIPFVSVGAAGAYLSNKPVKEDVSKNLSR